MFPHLGTHPRISAHQGVQPVPVHHAARCTKVALRGVGSEVRRINTSNPPLPHALLLPGLLTEIGIKGWQIHHDSTLLT